jgi:hypothetical protein
LVIQVIVADVLVIPEDVTDVMTGGPAGTVMAGAEVVNAKFADVEVPAELPELTAKL